MEINLLWNAHGAITPVKLVSDQKKTNVNPVLKIISSKKVFATKTASETSMKMKKLATAKDAKMSVLYVTLLTFVRPALMDITYYMTTALVIVDLDSMMKIRYARYVMDPVRNVKVHLTLTVQHVLMDTS